MNHLLKGFIRVCQFIGLALITLNCSAQTTDKGVIKKPTIGLIATYNIIKPKEIKLIMNGEELNHTDIPLGESFILVNYATGLTKKNGTVSIGCSLLIKDKKGKELINVPDLFEGDDILKASNVTRLRCTINTGKPMEWEEKYQVRVVFWDKYGTGKITNNFTIRMIDIP